MNVIVFSKDRPLQLEAYIESLIYFSGILSSKIIIIYKQSKIIPYAKVQKKFSDSIWIEESEFDVNLREAINTCDDYVMFGCDDVVFVGQLNLNECINYLEAHNEVFGVSLRLGGNITPHPKFLDKSSGFYIWDWSKANVAHYNYPWELDATLYRKTDVQSIIGEISDIKSPNFFESLIADNSEILISKKLLAFQSGRSKAVVITVNRVQETHQNIIDDTINYSTQRLYELYDAQDVRLDFMSISKMPTSRIHVGAEFMIFKQNKFMFCTFMMIKLKRKILTLFNVGFGGK
jgi:hypothetical protein